MQPQVVLASMDRVGIHGKAAGSSLREFETLVAGQLESIGFTPHERRIIIAALVYGKADKEISAELDTGVIIVKGVLSLAARLCGQTRPQAMLGKIMRLEPGKGEIVPAFEARRKANGKPITFRQKEIMAAVASGLKNREIAELLDITEQTVKNHMRAICGKLGVKNRVELAVVAGRGR